MSNKYEQARLIWRMDKRAISQSYLLRRLILADEPAMLGIIETARREYGMHGLVEDLYTTYQEPLSDYFVVTLAGVPVGGAGIAPLDGGAEDICELQRMYVSPEHRGKGIGQMLLDDCLRRASILGYRKCYAETLSAMTGAIRFYEANGFRRLGAALGSTGHDFVDCWLLMDLEVSHSGC